MPVITPSITTRSQAITDIIESVALEETALSHILNAEGEKIQKMVAMDDVTPEVLLATNMMKAGEDIFLDDMTREELSAAHREGEERQKELARLETELAELRREKTAAEELLTETEARLTETKEKLARAGQAAEAYEKIKDRTAGIELEAHCRAQNILDQANGQAKDLRRSMEQWMGRVEREYDALRSEVESTVSHAADQLEKANKCLDRMTALLSDQDVALEALSQAYDNTDPEKVPAPVPLNED